jgi:hypothetical protein
MLSYVLNGEPPPRGESGSDTARMEIVAVRGLPGQPVPESIRKGSVVHLETSNLYYQWLSSGRTIFVPQASHIPPELNEMMRAEFFRRRYVELTRFGAH